SVPPEDRPKAINVVRYSFHAMVGIGSALAALGVFYLFVWAKWRRLPRSKWFYRALVVSGGLAVIALETGWIVTEVGRQPWVAYGVMRTSDAVTHANGIQILFWVGVAVYTGLIAAVIWLLRKLAANPERLKEDEQTEEATK
ncbi:MAG: cytochrome ubiquinol oxidase subunit I, partial [Solirubrobacterales bacterium]